MAGGFILVGYQLAGYFIVCMKTEIEVPTSVHPSKQKLAKATIVAALVAIVILFVAVLPAEYGIDPLGTGAALGLTSLS